MINLEKKKAINLSKESRSLNQVKVGLSWDPAPDGRSADADASVFMLDASGKIPSEGFFVFFNNLLSEDGSVRHSGDNRTGAGDGDDEEISIALADVHQSVLQIILVITIHNKDEGFHFGNVLNSAVRVYDQFDNSIICQYKLVESFNGCDALIIGRFYRVGSDWEFEALGQAFEGGISATVELYS
jgi:tellurium resistance protein TerD